MVHGGADFIRNLVEKLEIELDPGKLITSFNVVLNIRTLIVLGGLLAWLFFRIKTLKH